MQKKGLEEAFTRLITMRSPRIPLRFCTLQKQLDGSNSLGTRRLLMLCESVKYANMAMKNRNEAHFLDR